MLAFLIRFASLFIVALWVGAGAAIAFFVAPVVFEEVRSRSLAGELVGRILRRFEGYALLAGPVACAAVFLEMAGSVGGGRSLGLKLALIAAMLGLSAYSRFALGPEMRALREQLGEEIDSVSAMDGRRSALARLHGFSVLTLMAQLVLGALAIAVALMAMSPR